MPRSPLDEFSPATIQLIAKRAGYICAFPCCGRMTVAASDDRVSGLTMTGIAAHITAAAPNGPRFDKDLTSEYRSSESNGIWTCQIHGKLIDDNESKYTTEELQAYKSQHEKWVFDRVALGMERNNTGFIKLKFQNIGVFSGQYSVPIGKMNIIVGDYDLEMSTFCRLISAFANSAQWSSVYKTFLKNKKSIDSAYLELLKADEHSQLRVRLSPVDNPSFLKNIKKRVNQIQIEVDDKVSPDWPREAINVLHFSDQLYGKSDTFLSCLRYLASVFGTTEDLFWDSIKEQFFVSSVLGFQIKRSGWRKLDVRRPDKRDFFLPHGGIGFSEQQLLFLDIALTYQKCHKNYGSWIYLFDRMFFDRLDDSNKEKIFNAFFELRSNGIQSVFCVSRQNEADMLIKIAERQWVNSEQFGHSTIHNFI